MSIRIGVVGLGLVFLASVATAQSGAKIPTRCNWCERGGQDIKVVKLFWFKWEKDKKTGKNVRVLDVDDSASIYKPYKGVAEYKMHETDADKVQTWVPEIFEATGGRPKADAYYFLCDVEPGPHFDGKKAGVPDAGMPVSQGQQYERGKPCEGETDGKKCQRMAFRKVQTFREGRVAKETWFCPVHIDAQHQDSKTLPYFIFGGLFLVVAIGVGLGLWGIQIGDKERAVEEPGAGGGGGAKSGRKSKREEAPEPEPEADADAGGDEDAGAGEDAAEE